MSYTDALITQYWTWGVCVGGRGGVVDGSWCFLSLYCTVRYCRPDMSLSQMTANHKHMLSSDLHCAASLHSLLLLLCQDQALMEPLFDCLTSSACEPKRTGHLRTFKHEAVVHKSRNIALKIVECQWKYKMTNVSLDFWVNLKLWEMYIN